MPAFTVTHRPQPAAAPVVTEITAEKFSLVSTTEKSFMAFYNQGGITGAIPVLIVPADTVELVAAH